MKNRYISLIKSAALIQVVCAGILICKPDFSKKGHTMIDESIDKAHDTINKKNDELADIAHKVHHATDHEVKTHVQKPSQVELKAHEAKEEVKKTATATKEKVQHAGEKIQEKAHELKEGAKHVAGAAKEKVEHAGSALKTQAVHAKNALQEGAQSAKAHVEDAAVRTYTTSRGYLSSLKNNTAIMLKQVESLGKRAAYDTVEQSGNVIVRVELPGFEKEEIEALIDDSALHIAAKKAVPLKKVRNGVRVYHQEIYENLKRVIKFPRSVDASKAVAVLKNGILLVEAPRKDKHAAGGLQTVRYTLCIKHV
jgi:HSP20 family molecular chaperone IbpA/gas vesicle protein